MNELDKLLGHVPVVRKPTQPRPARSQDYRGVADFATGEGFTVRSTVGGDHNRGSLHGKGRAVDVRTRDKKPDEVAGFIERAKSAGYRVRDERVRPAGQRVWKGPHLHLEDVSDELDGLLGHVPAVDAPALPSAPEITADAPARFGETSGGGAGRALALPLKQTPRPKVEVIDDEQADDDVVKINARSALAPPPRLAPLDPKLSVPESDADYRVFDVSLPAGRKDWSDVSGPEFVERAVRQYAAANNIPAPLAETFIERNAPRLRFYDMRNPERDITPVDLIGTPDYDEQRRTLRVSLENPIFEELRGYATRPRSDEFQDKQTAAAEKRLASRSRVGRAVDWAMNPRRPAGAKFMDVVEATGDKLAPAASATGNALEKVTRPLAAIDNALYAAANTRYTNPLADPLEEAGEAAWATLKGDELTPLQQNPFGQVVRKATEPLGPKVQSILGFSADALTSPSNLIPVGGALKVGKGVSRLARTRVGAAVTQKLDAAASRLFGRTPARKVLNLEDVGEQIASRVGPVRSVDVSPLPREPVPVKFSTDEGQIIEGRAQGLDGAEYLRLQQAGRDPSEFMRVTDADGFTTTLHKSYLLEGADADAWPRVRYTDDTGAVREGRARAPFAPEIEEAQALGSDILAVHFDDGRLGLIPRGSLEFERTPDFYSPATGTQFRIAVRDERGRAHEFIHDGENLIDARTGARVGDDLVAVNSSDTPVRLPPEHVNSPVERSPVPEPPAVLDAQMGALREGRRRAVLVTEGARRPRVPDGFVVTETPKGAFIHDPAVVSAQEVRWLASRDKHGSLLGHVEPKSADTSAVVVARDVEGRELQTSYASLEGVEAQVEELRRQFPESHIEVGGEETAQRVVEERAAQHHSNFQPRRQRGNGKGQFKQGSPAPPLQRPPAASPPAATATVPVPPLPPPRRFARTRRVVDEAVAIIQLPKALKASFDLSAFGGQGLPQVLAHPHHFTKALRAVRGAAVSDVEFDNFVRSIKSRPDYDVMKRFIDLSTTGKIREEAFASKYAKDIPGIKESDRAYSVALDSLRVQAWDLYTRDLMPDYFRAGTNVTDETFKALGELVNISTGRGVFPVLDRSVVGRKIVNFLNVPLFSPRNTAAKFNIISPRRLIANAIDPEKRVAAKIQLKEATRGLVTLTTTMGLLDLLPGVEVGYNPFSSGFGKVSVGTAHYDLTGGVSNSVRYMAMMWQAFGKTEEGESLDKEKTPLALTKRFVRSQLSPSASVAVDRATGETFDREPFTYSGAAVDLTVPFIVVDNYEAWKDAGGSSLSEMWEKARDPNLPRGTTGFGGLVKASPTVLGARLKFYDDSSQREWAGRPEPRELDLGPKVSREFKRLNIKVEPVAKSYSGEGQTGDAIGFSDDSPVMPSEMRAELESAYEREVRAAVETVILDPSYKNDFETDDERRKYLHRLVEFARRRTFAEFRLRVRERAAEETKRVEDLQGRLERGEHLKGATQNRQAVVGARRRDPLLEPQAEEDAWVLAEEEREYGQPAISDEQAARVVGFMRRLKPDQLKAFARGLEETWQLGVVGEGVNRVGEIAAEGLGAVGLSPAESAGVPRVMRMLAREMRLRPAQFDRDVRAGRYGPRVAHALNLSAEDSHALPSGPFPFRQGAAPRGGVFLRAR